LSDVTGEKSCENIRRPKSEKKNPTEKIGALESRWNEKVGCTMKKK